MSIQSFQLLLILKHFERRQIRVLKCDTHSVVNIMTCLGCNARHVYAEFVDGRRQIRDWHRQHPLGINDPALFNPGNGFKKRHKKRGKTD